jgi:ABC-type uncharacterized transport system involved in gliding motility auxiliary subunit
VSVPLNQTIVERAKQKPLALLGVLLVLLVLGSVGFFTIRSRRNAPATENAVTVPTPSPTPEATPPQSPSPTPSPKREQRKPAANENANKKKDSKVESALKKVRRILKKPF